MNHEISIKDLVEKISKITNKKITVLSDKKRIRPEKSEVNRLVCDNSKIKKVAAIGVRVSKWIAYHGFSININNNLKKYKIL